MQELFLWYWKHRFMQWPRLWRLLLLKELSYRISFYFATRTSTNVLFLSLAIPLISNATNANASFLSEWKTSEVVITFIKLGDIWSVTFTSWPHYYHHDIHPTPLLAHHNRLGQMSQNTTTTTTPLVTTEITHSLLVTTTASTSSGQPQSCFSKNCFKPIIVSSHPTNPPNDLRVKDVSETDLILEAPVSNTTSSGKINIRT